MSGNSEEKSEQASNRKLKKQREEGSVPRTSDMSAILNVFVSIVILASIGAGIFEDYKTMFDGIFITMFQTGASPTGLGLQAVIQGIVEMTVGIVVGTLLILLLVVTLYQGGLPFSFKPLVPDFGRLNPTQGFSRILGRRSWIESVFHLIRALIWLAISALVVWTLWDTLFRLDLCGMSCGLDALNTLIWRWMPITLFVLISYIGFEMLVQKNLYLHEQKMSKSDVKRESKEQTGAPELRQERNRLRAQLAKEAENADKSLANMCFYYGDLVVGIRYHPKDAPMPRVTARAKGEDAVHLRRYITEQGHPSMAHENIAKKASRISPGATISKDMFEELALAMGKMFARK